MSRSVERWVLGTLLVAAALLLVADLVDRDWLGAAIWALAILTGVLVGRQRSDSSSGGD